MLSLHSALPEIEAYQPNELRLFREITPFDDFNTPLTEPGQALQRALVRTVLPSLERLPAPLLQAAFPSLRSVQTCPCPV